MIQTVYINDMGGLKDLVFAQQRNEFNGRYRSSFFHRGVADESFSLTTSLYRNCGDKERDPALKYSIIILCHQFKSRQLQLFKE